MPRAAINVEVFEILNINDYGAGGIFEGGAASTIAEEYGGVDPIDDTCEGRSCIGMLTRVRQMKLYNPLSLANVQQTSFGYTVEYTAQVDPSTPFIPPLCLSWRTSSRMDSSADMQYAYRGYIDEQGSLAMNVHDS